MQVRLVLKAIFFMLLFPGTVTSLVPYLIIRSRGVDELPGLNVLTIFSLITGVIGITMLLYRIWEFAFYGKGTLSTIDPPKVLVVRGLYKHTRNPMYLAVVCILVSEAIFFRSRDILLYAVIIFLIFHLFVIFYEEPHLRKIFGERYEKYFSLIPRWVFSRKPFN